MKAPDEMPIKQLFEQVFIKSESDLPKEDGLFTTNISPYVNYRISDKKWRRKSFPSESIKIDWYFKPIEQPAEKEETITIPKWKMTAIEDVLRQANNIHHSQKKETCFDRCICKAWKFACDALNKEYSFESQSSPVMSPKPQETAEEIPYKVNQDVRKVLQSVALHGYDLISAESDIIKIIKGLNESK